MSDAFWANLPALVIACGTFAASITAAGLALWNNRKIEAVHKATNSMKDDLVKVTGQAEHAKGKLEGAREEEERRKS